MTVGNNLLATKSEGPFYVRLRNLPADSCQNQILNFFKELPVPVGGVSIHRNCAFVAFDSPVDARLAVSRGDQRVLGGKEVRVTIADHSDVRKTRMYDVRRQLVPECLAAVKSKKLKRIRPTMVKDCASASKNFCPDEIEFPGIESCSVDGKVPGHTPESCLVDGTVPGNAPESCLVVGKIPENATESCLVNGKVPENAPELCLVNGKIPGNAPELCLVNRKIPGNAPESCLVVEKIPENAPESYLVNGKVSGTKNESLLYDNVPGKNKSCLLDGNVPEKENESYKLCDNVVGSNYESCFIDGHVPGNNKSCFMDGNVSVKVSKNRFPDRKVPVKFPNANFQVQKTTEPVKRMPMKKTIKPTPVFTLSQFKLVYEGTVF